MTVIEIDAQQEAAWAAEWSSRADIALQYDVRARVPAFDQVMAGWGERGAATRAAWADAGNGARLDLRYGASADETLDLFLPPPGEGAPPLLVFLHGGFWRRLHKNDFAWIAPPYVARGVAVAVVNYGLAPATPLDEIVEQTRRSLAWLHQERARFGYDAGRMVVSGHSAGGHLACMALATDWPQWRADLPAGLLAGGIALSPLADLAPLAQVPVLHAVVNFTPERIRLLSPVRHAPATAAPLLGAVGGEESEEFIRQLDLLARTWPQVWHGAVAMPGHDHLSLCEAFADPASVLFSAALAMVSGAGC